jgi:hypothetical protein
MKILIILIVLVVLFYLKKVFSSFGSINNGAIVIMACHIKNNIGLSVIQNNINFLNQSDKIKKIIIVYSADKGVKVNFSHLQYGIPVEIIHDDKNVYYDFDKYKMGYSYIKEKKIPFDWIFVMNDSVIICEPVTWIIDSIVTSNKDFYGILEVNERIFNVSPKVHYQSWWLCFRKNAIQFWINNLKFNPTHKNVKQIINDFEINLSNKMINSFNCATIFSSANVLGNLFGMDSLYYDYYYNKNFKFVKLKHFHPELVPTHLKFLKI